MNVLLTGGGTLGEPLAQRLAAMGHAVRVLCRDAPAPRPGGVFEPAPGRLEDAGAVREAVAGCQAVIHNAAATRNRFAPDAAGRMASANVLGSVNVFSAAAAEGVGQVVFISCDSVLGSDVSADEAEADGRARCLRDGDPPAGRDLFDQTKIAAEQFARHYRERRGLSVTVLRPARFPAPGELADHEFAWRLAGACVWIGDVIGAAAAALANPAQGEYLIHAAVPFTGGEAESRQLLADPAAALAAYWPDEIDWWLAEGLPTPPIRVWADTRRARDELGFAPTLNFPEAVARMRAGKSAWPTAGVRIAAD